MYDTGKIVSGLVIFLGLVTLPVWYNTASGKAASAPELAIVTDQKECVESAQFMKDNHMRLLEQWRESAVRNGSRTYVSSTGKQYDISLTGTCLGCHSNKTEFCDTCHSYAGAAPNCWDCHNIPQEK